MALTAKQFDAINLLFDDRFTEIEVATQLGISDRTLRRWREIPEFKTVLDGSRKELFKRNRERLLASNQGRTDNKFERHRQLTERLNLVLATANLLSLEHTRIISILCRDLSRIEAEIAKELGQDKNVKIGEEEEQAPVDLNCLTNEESIVMELLENKIAAANPWTRTVFNHELSARDIALCKRIVDDLISKRNRERPTPFSPDKFGQATPLDLIIVSGE